MRNERIERDDRNERIERDDKNERIERIIPLSRLRIRDITKEKEERKSIANSHRDEIRDATPESRRILTQAMHAWEKMAKFREERERNKRYCYGDQWGDSITIDDWGCGRTMSEKDYIESQGNIPLKNNLIRRLVRNVVGVYRSQSNRPVCNARDRNEQRYSETMTTLLNCNWQLNKTIELNARTIEEMLISGSAIHKKTYGIRNGRADCWTDIVSPSRFFIDSNMHDVRGWDVSMAGEIHDVSFSSLCRTFARSKNDIERLRNIYHQGHNGDDQVPGERGSDFGATDESSHSFLCSPSPNTCRVIEVWRIESTPRYICHDYQSGECYKIALEDYENVVVKENKRRRAQYCSAHVPDDEVPLIESEWMIDEYWSYRFLSPRGDILSYGATPYHHGSHPYVFKFYPFIDGEVHSFVGDLIDQQRYVNRLVTLHDWIMRSSAKGVLLFPQDSLPDDMSLQDVADEWMSHNGVIAIKTRPGVPLPQQISHNCTNIGITELLSLQLKFFEEISGVSGALQGKTANPGTSGVLYAQQTRNATTSLLDILECYSTFVSDCAYKDLHNIQQYYDNDKIRAITGHDILEEGDEATNLSDVEFDLSIVEDTDTPIYRQLANDYLMRLFESGHINLEQLLKTGDFPFSTELLNSLQSEQQQD